MRLVTDIFAFCAQELPRWNTISISGYHMREAGGHGGTGAGIHPGGRHRLRRWGACPGPGRRPVRGPTVLLLRLLERAVRGGREVPGGSTDVGADHEGAVRRPEPALHDVPLPRPDRRLQPHGTSRSTTTWCAPPSRRSPPCWAERRACTPTHAMRRSRCRPRSRHAWRCARSRSIAYEAGVTETPDPLAGSYLVESLTNEVEAAAQAYLDRIDELGGAIAAIDRGFPAARDPGCGLPGAAGHRVRQQGRGRCQSLPGCGDRDAFPPAHRPRGGAGGRVARVRLLRQTRDHDTWLAAMDRLRMPLPGRPTCCPRSSMTINARATLGEISDRLRVAWGELP